MEIWFLLSILSVFLLAGTELLQQYIGNHKDEEKNFSPIESSLFVLTFQTIILFFISIFIQEDINIFSYADMSVMKWFALMTILNWFADIYYFKSLQVKSISLTNIFLGVSAAVGVFWGWLFMGEAIYFEKVLGLTLILTSVVLVYWKSVNLEKQHVFAFVAAFIYGGIIVIDSFVIKTFSNINPITYLFWCSLFMLVFGLSFYYKSFLNKIKKTKIKNFKNIFLTSFGYLLYNIVIIDVNEKPGV